MERIEALVERKREIFPELHLNVERENTTNSYWMSTVIFGKKVDFDRDALLQDMSDVNINARVFFYPLSMMPVFEDKPSNKVSYSLYSRGINLPSYHDIT